MNEEMMHGSHGGMCKCPHHKVVPLLILVIAIVFLLGAFDVFSAHLVGILWPIALGIIGIMKLTSGACKCC